MKNEDYKMKNEECRMKNEYYLNLNIFFIRSEATIGYAELKVLHSSFKKESAFIAAFFNCLNDRIRRCIPLHAHRIGQQRDRAGA